MLLFRCLTILLMTFSGTFSSSTVQAEEVHIAAASNFANTIKKISKAFENKEKINTKIAFASSGKHYAQIRHGAPFDVFLSADQSKPQALIDKGLAAPHSLFTYAIGTLVAVSRSPNSVDVEEQLRNGDFTKLALANPKLAPYGAAALEVLQYLELDKSSRGRWVMGENIAQTHQFLHSGNADIGFIALSQLQSDPALLNASHWIIPEHLYTPIKQDAVLLKSAMNNPAAVKFYQFLQSAEATAIISQDGYKTAAPKSEAAQ